MPSISAYSPYETLAFFQSVARYGASAAALQDISSRLTQNEHIRNSSTFDTNRFNAGSLQALYDQYTNTQNDTQSAHINGGSDEGERSPKRRKLSASRQTSDSASLVDDVSLHDLLDRLYKSYKDEAVKKIVNDEEAYVKLQEEIKKLEQQIATDTREQAAAQSGTSTTDVRSNSNQAEVEGSNKADEPDQNRISLQAASTIPETKPIASAPAVPTEAATPNPNSSVRPEHKANSPQAGDIAPPVLSTGQHARASQPAASASSQHPSPGAFPQQIPTSSAQRLNYNSVPTQPVYSPNPPPPAHLIPPMSGPQQRLPGRTHQTVNHGRGSPVPYQAQHPYPTYHQYPPPPPHWHPHMSPQPYQQHSPYGPSHQYYPQPPTNRHPQTPQQGLYAQYPHTAPVHYMQQQPQQQQQQQQQHWRGQQWPGHPTSAVTTPISRSNSRASLPGSGSSTPWKRKQNPSQLRPRSPSRPEREVSPLTDRGESPVPAKTEPESSMDSTKKAHGSSKKQQRNGRRGRPESATPSAVSPSRSQSIASRTSDIQVERQSISHRGRRIKAEPPSTPLPMPSSDTEQRSSGRCGRPRSSTVASQADGPKVTTNKRKRESATPPSSVRSPQPSISTPAVRRTNQSHDPSLVTVSKNFAKTSQLLLNEITSHKLAGIFAKPLSERDAPGYKDLVLRPQDLKSIKAAVSKGSRAALVAIDAAEADGDTSHPTGARALGNGFYLVQKSFDLVPPKGIVNSTQLEMELIRMFANAIMFNPLPPSERGFGRSLRLRKNGGDVYTATGSETESTLEDSDNGSTPGADEGGIIADTREMFNDVVEIVGKWRKLEDERMGAATDFSTSRHGSLAVPHATTTDGGRHASVSASSNIGDEDTMAGESEAASTPVPHTVSGTGRKKRKIAEH